VTAFTKARRLRKKNEYSVVFQNAKKFETPEFLFLYRENDIGFARLGLAISKKKIALACERNKIKRLLRETFRVSVLPAVDIIVLVRRKSKNPSTLYFRLNRVWGDITRLYKPSSPS